MSRDNLETTGDESEISLPFGIFQLVKSQPFHIPEAWKRYPFRAEPPRLGDAIVYYL